MRQKRGGCWGYIDEKLYDDMIQDQIISKSGTILKNGFMILGNI
jgi:hypothetical protein